MLFKTMTGHISFIKLWSSDPETIEHSFKFLITNGREVKTLSTNTYIKVISCLVGIKNSFLSKLENAMVADTFFLRKLEEAEQSGLVHDDILIKAIQESDNREMNRVTELQMEAKQKQKENHPHVEPVSLLENTYDEDLAEMCPINPHDSNNFYTTNPKTGKKELLKPHHIFQYRGKCYDIDTVFHYVNEGGQINLDADYIKDFFNKNGKVDFSDSNLTTTSLKKKTYHENTKTLILSGNSITTTLGVHFPETTLYLNLDNNPLGNNYSLKDETPNLLFLSIRNCGLDEINFNRLPESLTILDLRDNKDMKGMFSLSKLKNIKRLDIRNTGIRKLDWSKFKTPSDVKKLVIICDRNIEFKKTKPEWIEVIYE